MENNNLDKLYKPFYKSNLFKRILSAILLLPVVLYALYDGQYIYLALIASISVIAFVEWLLIVNNSNSLKTIAKIEWYALGLIYALSFSWAIIYLRNSDNGLLLVFWLLLTVWSTDSGAYFIGILLGGPKIAPKISPNKTWSGCLGGIISAILVSLIFNRVYGSTILPINYIIMSLATSIISQLGDLWESYFKRRFNVKDSSNLIPGHGGVLDRIDGLAVASIFTALVHSALS